MAKHIDSAAIAEMREYTKRLRERGDIFEAEYGRRPLALCETHGCQQNENDTERIRGMLRDAGYEFCTDANEADLVVFNTCAVRENAEDKVFGRIGILKHIKESRPHMMIVLCGCMVQQEHIAAKIKSIHSHIDLIFGTHALYRMPELLYKAYQSRKTVVDIENSDGAIAEDIPIMREAAHKAWVSVMYGCNNFCSYCIVPYVRGRERSRDPEKILDEIRSLVADGVSEISLLGQNVNSYGKDLERKIDFADLLRMVNEIEGIKRIRFMTSHPKDFGDRLISAMAECDKVCPQLHLPAQAGSDKVLADMNRRYTHAEYIEKLNRAKARIPNLALSTDIIVGFPTETQEDFEQTIELLKEAEYDSIFSFIYSRREGTPAAKLSSALSDEQIHRNFERMLEVQNEISRRKNEAYVGRTCRVLIDGTSKTDNTMLTGRTDTGKIVNFPGDAAMAGTYADVEITKAHTWSLYGKLK
jgi:tRNA-2-methylthio-N6-dimethylallyladenosine synthase